MNDDFLYRIRTEPPPHFAHVLKQRLDRTSKRGAKLASFGFGLFLFGTAFALVLPVTREVVAGWFGAKPNDPEIAHLAATPAAERTGPDTLSSRSNATSSPSQPAEGEFPPDRILPGDEKFSDPVMEDKPAPPGQRAASARDAPAGRQPGVPPPTAASVASAEVPPAPRSEFIVTGPLLAEPRTAAYAFEKRRALFTVMAWTMEPVLALVERRSSFDDSRRMEVAGKRLEQLTYMIPDVFTHDTSRSGVPTRSRARVWEDSTLFAKRVEEMEVAARLLTIAAMKGNEAGVRQAAAKVVFACVTCHEEFRTDANNSVGEKYP